jgi:hypothetical protein
VIGRLGSFRFKSHPSIRTGFSLALRDREM